MSRSCGMREEYHICILHVCHKICSSRNPKFGPQTVSEDDYKL